MTTSPPDDRNAVFANIRAALASHDGKPRASLPDWDASDVVCRPPKAFADDVDYFRFRFEATAGIVVEGWDALISFLQKKGVTRGYSDPAFAEHFANTPFAVAHTFDRSKVEEYEFGVTRASAAIAETGSMLLTETGSSSRIGALSPWLHVAVLDKNSILPNMPAAVAQFGNERATLFVTGPSKTADVEGILIQGVHGPGIQVCCLV